ncbi:ras association domain-containing protein 10-like [Daktulosphaira vitifoliae]|uniref:ras association domain-containing protein 10-like n=1 Tax=Daktulosphaira vitifoliae TaxID=58002 RepID=UPI0021A9D948|nr:ras association domain-containing protein 10-like [Daktulosphaira vitifoliae]
MTSERIPIWLYDKKLWINYADRRTTCADIITNLTGHDSKYVVTVEEGSIHPGEMIIAEPGAKILKIWQSLGLNQKLCLQKVGGSRFASDDTSELSYAQRKKRREVVKYASRTVHPKRLSNTQAAEELLKIILEQSDTIRTQLKKLQDRDKKIEKIETDTHKTRSNVLGTNYLLEAYMGDDKEEKDSGIAEGAASIENDEADFLEAITYLEQIVKINKKLCEHEERLIRLFVNIERCRDKEQLLNELQRVDTQIKEAEQMFYENSELLNNSDINLRNRLGYIEQLQYEAAIVDSENEYLMSFIENNNRQQSKIENHSYRTLDTLV